MFSDSHAHLSGDSFSDEAVDALLQRASSAHVSTIINIATDLNSLSRALLLHQKHPWVYPTAAITPHDVGIEPDASFEVIEQAARLGSLVAIGETGLDNYNAKTDPAVQKEHFIRYLQLAKECKLPVIIHCREAFNDLFKLLDQYYKNEPFVLHCFTGTVDEAEGVLNRGGYLSLSGIVTFKKSDSLREIAKIVPLDRLLIETDAPYLAPQSMRGKVNEPSFLPETAACIAALKNISLDEMAFQTTQNVRTLFKI